MKTLKPVPQSPISTPGGIVLHQERERQDALDRLHDARTILGAAGFHDMAREVASLIARVNSAKPNGNPVA